MEAIKAELTDGRIISLDGPCEVGCITHAGPHWLHMDRIDQWLNSIERFNTATPALISQLAEDEIQRLDRRKAAMQAAGIVRLIEDAT